MNAKRSEQLKPRIYSAPKSRSKITIVLALTAVLGLFIFLIARHQAAASVSQTTTKFSPPQIQPHVEKPTARTSAAPPDTQRKQPPDSAEGQAASFEIELESVHVNQGASQPGQVQAEMSFTLNDLSKNPDVIALLMKGKFSKMVLDDGKEVKFEPFQIFGVDKTIQRTHKGRFSIATKIPDSVNNIRLVEGRVPVVFAKSRGMVQWNDLANARGQMRASDGFEFTIAECKQSDQVIEVDIQYKPPAIRPLEPQNWPTFFVTPAIRFADGSRKVINAGSTGIGAKVFDLSFSAHTGGKAATALELDFVSSIEQVEAKFSFQNVALADVSTPARTADNPLGPRGLNTIVSQGYKFQIHSLELKQEKTPYILIKMIVTEPAGTKLIALPFHLSECVAKDDQGVTMKQIEEPFFCRPQGLGPPVTARFNMPGQNAERFIAFSGKYDVYVADEKNSIEFALPLEGKDLSTAFSTPPVSLDAVTYSGGFVTMKTSIDLAAIPEPKYSYYSVTREIQDAKGLRLGY